MQAHVLFEAAQHDFMYSANLCVDKSKSGTIEATIDDHMAKSSVVMRGLVRSVMFNGTLSAGGGSCQATVKGRGISKRLGRSW